MKEFLICLSLMGLVVGLVVGGAVTRNNQIEEVNRKWNDFALVHGYKPLPPNYRGDFDVDMAIYLVGGDK